MGVDAGLLDAQGVADQAAHLRARLGSQSSEGRGAEGEVTFRIRTFMYVCVYIYMCKAYILIYIYIYIYLSIYLSTYYVSSHKDPEGVGEALII